MQHRLLQLAAPALLAAATLSSRPAQACGGFFCSQSQPVNQSAERIIFADNGDGTITALIQIQYQGPSESFSWLLPIGSVPQDDELGVGSDVAFTRLQSATNPQYNLITEIEGTCNSGRSSVAPNAGVDAEDDSDAPGGINVDATGVVGPFEWSVISVDPSVADPAEPAADWLTQNGYDIPEGGAALIGPYLADGMHLLALRLTKDADTGSIRPIRLTYSADAPMIPIKLTAVAATQDMGVMTWALSNARAVPFNYNALELNEARINWFNASSNYNQVVTEAADEAGGQGFVTEFAGPSSQLANVVWSDADEQGWQSIRSASYTSFNLMFETLYINYQGYSGFWDAIRRSVTLEPPLTFEDFRACPTCYQSDDYRFSPSQLFDTFDQEVLEPLRSTQALIDAAPYATRLYSTLSAAEMTVDPVFVFNPDLPDVSNLHQARQVIECGDDITQSEASWRIELPQGGTVRGRAVDVGQWPAVFAEQPPNVAIRTLSATGEGAVVADNGDTIDDMLASYNAGVPSTSGGSGGFCTMSPAPRSMPLALVVLGGALGAMTWRRRRPS
jgi:hypothetical protein